MIRGQGYSPTFFHHETIERETRKMRISGIQLPRDEGTIYVEKGPTGCKLVSPPV
jgi:hypothetical protein